MSANRGRELAQLQHYFAENWNEFGPEHVAGQLEQLDPHVALELLMVNIGSYAAKLPQSQAN